MTKCKYCGRDGLWWEQVGGTGQWRLAEGRWRDPEVTGPWGPLEHVIWHDCSERQDGVHYDWRERFERLAGQRQRREEGWT